MTPLLATADHASASNASASQVVSYAAPQLGFGGYNWFGTVHEIGASWQVPAISPNSRSGDAATWVGAQNNAGEFIQIGTEEDRGLYSSPSYDAFWSDAVLQFVPQYLGTVKPGDTVKMSMVQKGYGWTIRVADRRSSLYVTRAIDYGFEDKFTLAEWVQENPSSYSNGLPTIPYPAIADTTFHKLVVNGIDPHLTLADGLVLITSSGKFRVPTVESNDSFSLIPPTKAQDRYLTDLSPSDGEAVVFGNELAHWSEFSASQRSSDISQFVATIKMTSTTLAGFSWPPSSSSALTKYVAECKLEVRMLDEWNVGRRSSGGSSFSKWLSTEIDRQNLAYKVSASLDLPPFS
ncbi:MAG: hypothetical protein ACHQFZ_02810 [Acidimicrobiales bacterium]